MSKNIGKLSGRKGLGDNLFERVAGAVGPAGPRPEAIQQIAEDFHLGAAVPYATASFYDFLHREHLDKKVAVCNGSSCLCAGTQQDLADKLAATFSRDDIGEICCLGRCHENAAFQYQGQNYSGDAIGQWDAIVAGKAPAGSDAQRDSYHVESTLEQPILTAEFPGVAEFYNPFEQALRAEPEDVLAEIKTSGLRGRGGAGFPMGLKWESAKNEPSDQRFIICNADEGDPGAFIDRYLLEQQPHAVLLGMLVAGYCVGACEGVLYIRAEYPESQEAIAQAIAELESAGLVGDDIRGSGFDFRFKVIKGQGAYICGEETSLIASIEGRRAEVNVRPPYPTVEGLYGKPTVVNNVESLSCVHHILTIGGDAFAQIGTERSTGPKLASLDGAFNRPGIYEVPMGTPLVTIVEDLGQGFRRPTKAIQVGGPLGGIVPINLVEEMTFDFESFKEAGFLLGHAGIVGIPESMPMIEYAKHLLHFCAVESCGKCFPCRLGSVRGEELLGQAIDGVGKIDRALLDDLLEALELTSLCGLGGGIPLPIRNILDHFSDEISPYFAGA